MVGVPPISSHQSLFATTQRKYRLSQAYRYRPTTTVASVFGAKLASKTAQRTLDFELVQEQTRALHPLGYLLATIFATSSSIKRLFTSFFGLIPENSLLDKCPYYRTASEESTPNLPASLKWVSVTSGRERESRESRERSRERAIDSSLVGYRKRYHRDSLTLPAMVVVYNTALVWMMFNIEVRASSL